MAEVRKDNWAKGANNIANPSRLPEGSVRDLLNLDASPGGTLDLRAGYEKVYEGVDVRAGFAFGSQVVMVDGGRLMLHSTGDDTTTQLATVANAGPVGGTVFNSQLYLSTLQDSLRFDGHTIKPWAVPPPTFTLGVTTGTLAPGVYKVAVTCLGVDGEESGALPQIITLGANQGLSVFCADSRSKIVYCSAADGETLYAQGTMYGTLMGLGPLRDDLRQLTTMFLEPLPAVSMLTSLGGSILGAVGNYLYKTRPMYPHLYHPVKDFFQFAAPITVIVPASVGQTSGLYVCADKTYFLTDIDGDSPTQQDVFEFGGVAGSAVTLPDGRATWFTPYGLAIGNSQGQVDLPNRSVYSPDIGSIGAAGYVEHEGKQLVVTTMRGQTKLNGLSAGDFYDVEIVDER